MPLHLKFIILITALTVFAVTLLAMTHVAIDQAFPLAASSTSSNITTSSNLNNTFLNAKAGFYADILAVTFLLTAIFLFLTRQEFLKNPTAEKIIKSEPFKLLYSLSFLPAALFVIMDLILAIFTILQTGTLTTNSLLKLGALILIFGPMLLLIKTIFSKKNTFILVSVLTLLFYFLAAAGSSLFIFTKIGPPWIETYIEEDTKKISELRVLQTDIQDAVDQSGDLPKNLKDLPNASNLTDLNTFKYSIKGTKAYEICTTFKLSDTSADFPHPAGNFCQTETVDVLAPTSSPTPAPTTEPTFAPLPTQAPAAPLVHVVPPAPPAVPLTCKTLNTEMVTDPKGFGYIGCDMEVTSDQIDVSRSYCESQTTHQKEFLAPDAYGRPNRYWNTLTNLDPHELVKVYAYSKAGARVECLPDLNG